MSTADNLSRGQLMKRLIGKRMVGFLLHPLMIGLVPHLRRSISICHLSHASGFALLAFSMG
jgi:hypothetical protein